MGLLRVAVAGAVRGQSARAFAGREVGSERGRS